GEKGRKNRKQKRKEKNTKKRKIPTSVHFLLQSKKFRNRKNPKEKESRSSSIHTTAAEITEQERRDHQAQALTNSLILPKFTKAKTGLTELIRTRTVGPPSSTQSHSWKIGTL
ncbi:hypothetical protein LINPERPRIM_LOCUS9044, partial [Linum perenne]